MSHSESAVTRSRLEPFFVHVGSFVAVIVYFVVLGSAPDPAARVYPALPVALAVMSGYMLAAHRVRLLKQFDIGLWSMFAVGTATVLGGSEIARTLFANYSVAILFGTLGLVAAVPLLLGIEPFTTFFARRGTPVWQQKTRDFVIINRIITVWFAVLFGAAAALAAWAPHDFRFVFVYPNLLVFVAGLPSQLWIPPLYLRLFGPHPPETVEAAILGMPLNFDAKAAVDAEASIQFRVEGADGGDFWVRVAGGECESSEGSAASPDLTIVTQSSVWLRIARGELDGAQALLDRQYSIEGDGAILMRFAEWFPSRR
jgi:putative sterol carrier protein